MKRPPKPRIAKSRLKWVWNKRKWVWEPYHRTTWSEDGKQKERAVLLKWDGDAQKLDDEYWRCESGKHQKQSTPAKYTWGELIVLWRKDPRVQGKLAASTKASYRRDMDRILEKNAHKDMRNTTKKAIRDKHASMALEPRKADKYLSVISLLWNYAAKKQDWPLDTNPALGIDRFGKQREFEPWPDWMIQKLTDAPDIVQRAGSLIMNTGQRPTAAIGMKFTQFDGEWMTVLDEKQDEYFDVFCPLPLQDDLKRWKQTGSYVIAKNLREPLGYDAVEKRFRAWRERLGDQAKKYSMHGLRKVAIIRLAEAGATDAEIQAVTNQSAEMVAYYRKKANRKALSKAAQTRQTRT